MVNELPHFFYLTLKYQCAVHSIPNAGCLNPADYKSGDLFVDKFGISVETKSHSFFRFIHFHDLKKIAIDFDLSNIKEHTYENTSDVYSVEDILADRCR
jgi:hypothetical protein